MVLATDILVPLTVPQADALALGLRGVEKTTSSRLSPAVMSPPEMSPAGMSSSELSSTRLSLPTTSLSDCPNKSPVSLESGVYGRS